MLLGSKSRDAIAENVPQTLSDGKK